MRRMNAVRIKRIYEEPDDEDGYRVLVDRLWPRGMAKERAQVDLWLKEVAPSAELRGWFHSGEGGFPEFSERYRTELERNPAVSELNRVIGEHPVVTLLYSVKDPEDNHAVVLKRYVEAGEDSES